MGNPGSSSSSGSYDVFLSFHRSDTRGFTDFLYHGLVDAGMRVFRDVEELPSGADMWSEQIERSKIAIPIISRDYPSNRLLMDNLVKIYEFKKKMMNRIIIPVFYYVNPSQVSNCKDYFWSGGDSQDINLWKLAFGEITNLKGFSISDDGDGEALIMKRIISIVVRQLHNVSVVVPRNLVGVEHHVRNILEKLNVAYDGERAVGVRVVGICGRSGIGKTTLARIIYDHLRPLYCSSAFVANTGERSLPSLLEQLVWDLQKLEYVRPLNFEEGCETLKLKFRQKRVLIVLDDVGDFEQIKQLAAKLHWFGPGSRIIITSKARDVLNYYNGADTEIYELEPLEYDKAFELFCKRAFRKGLLQEDYRSPSESICYALGGLPLAIKIVGSYLKGKGIETWEQISDTLKKWANEEAGASRESSHVLREFVKEIFCRNFISDYFHPSTMEELFFEIAHFLFAADERFVLRMWGSYGGGPEFPNDAMRELRRLCLVETAETKRLGMHRLLRDIGREMAEQEDPKGHDGLRRSCIDPQDALATLKEGKGTAKIEALCLTLDRNSDICFKSENFKGLSNLRYLRLNHAAISGDFENLLSELRWLEWHGCPSTFQAANMLMRELVVLDLSWSNITEDWQGWTEIQRGKEAVVLPGKAKEQSIGSGFECSAESTSEGIITGQQAERFARESFLDLERIVFLKLGSANIHGDFVGILPNLRWLEWQGCPETLEATNLHLENLAILDLSWSKVTQDWEGWSQLKMIKLKVLNLTGCTNLLVTPGLSRCQYLEMLILEGCIRLIELHPSIGDLTCLVSLNLKSCSELNTLPEELDKLKDLEELLIDGTPIQDIPSSIGDMKQLKIFSASSCTRLSGLPESIGELVKLKKLSLRDCCQLAKLPNSIGNLGISLEELDVSGTSISRLPESITNLQRLKVLRMDFCFIKEFPHNIGKLIRLEEIHASWCTSMEGPIPNDIGKVKRLRILKLQHSRISSLPAEIQQLSNLQTLDLLHCDKLEEFPKLPSNLTELHINPRLLKIIKYSDATESINSMV